VLGGAAALLPTPCVTSAAKISCANRERAEHEAVSQGPHFLSLLKANGGASQIEEGGKVRAAGGPSSEGDSASERGAGKRRALSYSRGLSGGSPKRRETRKGEKEVKRRANKIIETLEGSESAVERKGALF
jgi:hypothetical protein